MSALASSRPAAVGQAPGKLILIGEHAVVHGAPAIALPFPAVCAQARLEGAEGPLALASSAYSGPFDESACPEAMFGLVRVARRALEETGGSAAGCVRIDSTIPFARGLGSSAAVALALVRAIYAAAGRTLSAEAARGLVHEAERAAHGNPSGVDAEAVTAAGPIWFRRGQPAEPLVPGAPLHLVVADSGRARDTRAAVAAVQARLLADAAGAQAHFERLAALAGASRQALESGATTRLGALLDDAQQELAGLGVSAADLERLIQAARQAGALGAKLTGAGCGGCVLALAPDTEAQAAIASALRAAGAHATWCHTVGKDGV